MIGVKRDKRVDESVGFPSRRTVVSKIRGSDAGSRKNSCHTSDRRRFFCRNIARRSVKACLEERDQRSLSACWCTKSGARVQGSGSERIWLCLSGRERYGRERAQELVSGIWIGIWIMEMVMA